MGVGAVLNGVKYSGWCVLRTTPAHNHRDAPYNQHDTRKAADSLTRRGELLKQHVKGKTRDPQQVHDARIEQQAHDHPATTEAERTVLESHEQCAVGTTAPTVGKKNQSVCGNGEGKRI